MYRFTFLIALLFSWGMMAQSNSADTTFVYTEEIQLDYFNSFDLEVEFPDGDQTYRQIIMTLSLGQYNCPAGSSYCHQWDYTTDIQLLVDGEMYELGRFMTPFATSGWSRFGPNWQQPYIFDVSDFYPLLKGEKEVRIRYDGYSGGFTAKIEFAFIEGTPEREVLDIKPAYQLIKAYGNAADPFNDYLDTFSDTAPEGTEDTLLKVIVSGHGADATEQCCEFSSHYFDVLVDDEFLARDDIWRDNCGENNLYPQGGTWIYDRANWCPGARVHPFYYNLNVSSGQSYNLDIEFEDYTGSGDLGHYNFNGVVFYYGAHNKETDAAIVDIVSPTDHPNHYRENPSADSPVIKVKNIGSTAITSLDFNYGVIGYGQSTHSWTGNIAPQTEQEIALTALEDLVEISLNQEQGPLAFEVEIVSVNGEEEDDDLTNNYLSSFFEAAPTWPSQIIMDLKTGTKVEDFYLINSGPSDISWRITDMEGNTVAEKTDAIVRTAYKDTVTLPNTGFYKMKIENYNCFGLHWWPFDQSNAYQAGFFKVTKLNGTNIPMKNYKYVGTQHDDWGCSYTVYFTVDVDLQGVEDFQKPQFTVYPNPATEMINVQLTGNLVPPYEVKLVDLQGRTVYEKTIKDDQVQVPVDNLTDGMYMLIFKDHNNIKHIEKIIVGR